MSKKMCGVVALGALCGLSLSLLNCGSTVNRSSGLLYVLSQGSNNVESYAINLTSGNLSLINSNASTCATAPCGLPADVVLDPASSVAFVLNAGGGGVPASIYGYKVNSDGSLGKGSDVMDFANDMAVAMVRDPGGKFLFVITQGAQLYALTTQSGSTSLSLASQKTLTRIPTGIAAIPGPNSTVLLYVTSNKDLAGTNDNTVSEFAVDASGSVTEQVGSPYPTASNPSAVVAVATSPIGGSGGLFVYVTNVTTNSISAYQVCTVQTATCTQQNVSDLTLLPVGTPVNAGSNPAAMVVDPKSNFLYVASKISNQVFGFRINATQGTLSALSPANMSTGLAPTALAMHSSGKFLFVSNNGSSNISSFTLDTTSGAMSSPLTVTSSAQPAGLVSK